MERRNPLGSETIIGNNSIAELLKHIVADLFAGKTDQASARCDFMLALRKMGFWRLSSDEDWVNAIIAVNTQIRQGWRQYNDGVSEAVLDVFPAQELFNLRSRQPEPYNWAERWVSSGGEIINGRMVALKNDDVWRRISEFDLPFPTYARRSGMWVRDIRRDEAMQLGLIDSERRVCIQPVPRPKLIIFDPDPSPDEEL